MEIYTIGFTQTSAEHFFGRLKSAGVKRLLDVRLNNSSQLAGFAKARDLPYFLEELVGAEYAHQPLLAPSQDILDEFKKNKGEWSVYEEKFNDLMRAREVERSLDRDSFLVPTALLCSEAESTHCHRRLVLEHLARCWGDLTIVDL